MKKKPFKIELSLDEFSPDRIVPEGMILPDEPIPVTLNFDQERVVGRAQDFDLDAEGRLRADVELVPEFEALDNMPEGIFRLFPSYIVQEWEEGVDQEEGVRIITKSRILEVSFCPVPPASPGT